MSYETFSELHLRYKYALKRPFGTSVTQNPLKHATDGYKAPRAPPLSNYKSPAARPQGIFH